MEKSNNVFLILGSNLGNREEQLKQARMAIESEVGEIEQSSKIYETASWGKKDLPAHLNQVLAIKSHLTPLQVLEKILEIETRLGRKRTDHWGSRTMDIDILYYNKSIIHLENLKIPHPLISERRFVLTPLCDIAEDFVHPEKKVSNAVLLQQCEDDLSVKVFEGLN